jgi:membrane protein YdbS with pleckstrin-like domain
MLLNLEETYRTVLLKEMLENELEELESAYKCPLDEKTVSKAAIRKTIMRLFVWVPIFMVLVNYVRNGVDLFIFIYTPVFLFYTAIYTAIIVLFIYVYNFIVRRYNKSKVGVNEASLFFEQNKVVLQENIKTVEDALMTKSTLIPMYHSKVKLGKMIEYMKKGRARTDEDAIYLFEKEHPRYSQPGPAKRKRCFINREGLTKRMNRFSRFISMVFFASLVAKSLNRSSSARR